MTILLEDDLLIANREMAVIPLNFLEKSTLRFWFGRSKTIPFLSSVYFFVQQAADRLVAGIFQLRMLIEHCDWLS